MEELATGVEKPNLDGNGVAGHCEGQTVLVAFETDGEGIERVVGANIAFECLRLSR